MACDAGLEEPVRLGPTTLLFWMPIAIDCVSPNARLGSGTHRKYCRRGGRLTCRTKGAGRDRQVAG
jgi:hypothetical protein